MDGPKRFADLQEDVEGIATNVLAERLRRLAADRLVLAVPYSRRPLRFSYQLTDPGRGLGDAVRALARWSAEHGGAPAPPPLHDACGTPLVARWWCPTCDADGDGDPAAAAGEIWI